VKEKKTVTREYKFCYQKASKKEKNALLDEFTRFTDYRLKHAVRILGARTVKQVMVYIDGKPVKIRPEKRWTSNRKGKHIYSDEVINALRMVCAFFWFKWGKILALLMGQQMSYRPMADFRYRLGNRRKLKKISPASIDRYLKKDKEALRLKGKSLTKPIDSIEELHPYLYLLNKR
jgi:hypothetical protein